MNLKVKLRLKEILYEKNMTQAQLSQLTGITQPKISELVNMKRTTIKIDTLNTIITALEITDVDRVFKIVDEDDWFSGE
ncbi:helix-turn-helix domain-containing protein [Halalkalibacter oceani]|uniref:helix-turn-helix domain-containing protein n=1 Tax=Halalkalibacter oceani TaxID=1653776 RepID=UPI00339244E6